MKLYSVVIPVYNEEETLVHSYERLKSVMDKLNNPYELIFVDDGSRDGSYSILQNIADKDMNAKAIILSRNFGHQTAVTAGMKAAKGDAVIIIDADMQDPPELIPEMIKLWKAGSEIVYGKRNKRLGESKFKKFTASAYYRLLGKFSDEKLPEDVGDFRLLDRKVVDVMNAMGEHNRYLRGMSAWTGFRQTPLPYTREERKEGKSKYTLRKMLKLASDGIMSMSAMPLKLIFRLGIALGFIGALGLIAELILALTAGFSEVITIIAALIFCTGITVSALGVVGAYIIRIYDEVKGRPLYIISEMINFKE